MAENSFFADVDSVPYVHSPDISPDGSFILFVYAGDLWRVEAEGGKAHPVTTGPGYDRSPRVSPDASRVAFTSNRTGNGDLYVLDLNSGELRRLTHFDGGNSLGGWSPDGEWLLFTSRRDGLSGGVFKVHLDGGTPIEVFSDPRESQNQCVFSPDGKRIAYVNDASPFWRRGPLPMPSSIWTLGAEPGSDDFERVTSYSGRNVNPVWPVEDRNFYISDEGGTENVWVAKLDVSGVEPITTFEEGRCLGISASEDGRWIVLDRMAEIWRHDLQSGEASKLDIGLVPDQKVGSSAHRVFSSGLDDEFHLSPDGKKVLFGVHGELFAAPSEYEETYTAIRVTDSPFREQNATWHPESAAVAYLSDRFGNNEVLEHQFSTRREKRLTDDQEAQKLCPRYSPDGQWIAYVHNNDEVRLIERETGKATEWVKGALFTFFASSHAFAWSPDSKWIVFAGKDENFFTNLYVQAIGESEAHQLTYLSRIGCHMPLWAPNGKFVIFTTQQYRTQGQIARVDLLPVPPVFKEDDFEKLFEEENEEDDEGGKSDSEDDDEKKEEKETEPVEIDFEGLKRRLRLLTPSEYNAAAMAISPDSKTLVLRSALSGKPNLWSISLLESKQDDPPKRVTDTRGEKSWVHFSKDGKKIYYLDGGAITYREFPDGKTKKLRVRAEMDVDFHVEKRHVFQEAWTLIRDHFYDPEHHGTDWNQIKERYLPLVAGVQVQADLQDILNLMVGELNGSHLGASSSGRSVRDGYLGLRFDPKELAQGRYVVDRILRDSPCSLIEEPILQGDRLVDLDGRVLNARTNWWEALKHKSGKKIKVGLVTGESERREVDVRPLGGGALSNLAYRDWVHDQAEYVDKISKGRLGYVHIKAMGLEDLNQFLIDLDTEAHSKEGVVVDVRYNGGGHIATFILDVLAKRDYLSSTYRGKIKTSSANLAGDRILDKPTVLLTNEHSGSNAEMFSEGYRRLGLGKVVGTPTMGAVIWTGSWELLDGTTFRLPFIRVSAEGDENLELAPRVVDIHVERPPGEAAKGVDSQIDKAVGVLLGQIDAEN
jgi:tricorn protease